MCVASVLFVDRFSRESGLYERLNTTSVVVRSGARETEHRELRLILPGGTADLLRLPPTTYVRTLE